LAEKKQPRATRSAKDGTSLARPASWASLTIPMSCPVLIVTEFMENGALDSFLR
ncbi:hypothetical protein M9458_003054, partial [Cirrhinus mrigala]